MHISKLIPNFVPTPRKIGGGKEKIMSGVTFNGVNMTWDEYISSRKYVTKRKKPSISQSDKLISRLNKELGLDIPLGMNIRQLNPSQAQLARGSFKWTFDGIWSKYGSTLSIRELLRAKSFEISYTPYGGLSTMACSLLDIQPES